MTIVLATANPHKVAELKALFANSPCRWQSLLNYPNLHLPEETGATFAENARLKAEAVVRETGTWALADDSGLCVDALGSAPGIHSARYAGCHGDAQKNIAKLLVAMRDIPMDKRQAYFIGVMVLAGPGGEVRLAEGRCDGEIALSPRGAGGFGYDPIFWLPALGKTMAELSDGGKNAISHRALAATQIQSILAAVLPPDTSPSVC
ncbi:MAG: RdgB/HAM1 family non-canonical purine NTP pyrophosphatase, partial [Deltaproteobacteria bacterium]|nr:RdgB/HAM1 family non-canonical purine NTP pyrophosphatase [Deltaproteobacteria bacterium]